ncbi:MAG: SDR family oxidoreductase [Limnochordales bacterium]|nr:SDR family oxidoreductase [Limnochordales bacterium]
MTTASPPSVPAPVALVTGANRGIGLEVARLLGERGMAVLMGARDPSRGAAAAARLQEAGLDATALHLDVTDGQTIRAAADWIAARYGRLDVLVNNAAVSLDAGVPPSQATLEQLRQTYETNVFGAVAVTQAMLPLLKRAPAGRIVNMSSALASLGTWSNPYLDLGGAPALAYASSKAALNAVTVLFAYELRGTGIKVNAAEPGMVATAMNPHGVRPPAEGAAIAVRLATLPPDGPTGGFFADHGVIPW